MTSSLDKNNSFKVVSAPTNSCELFMILESMSKIELRILDTYIYLSKEFKNHITASRKKKAENSGCSEVSIKRFDRKFSGIFFIKNIRKQETNLVSIFSNINTELINLKELIVHLQHFLKYKLVIGHFVLFKNLTFKDLNDMRRGVIKSAKLFITLEKEMFSEKIVHNFISHRGKPEVMNRNDTPNDPPLTPKMTPNIIYNTLVLKIANEPSFSNSNFVVCLLKKYQLFENIKSIKHKSWETYSESQLVTAFKCMFYSLRNPKAKARKILNPSSYIEAYIEKALKNKWKSKLNMKVNLNHQQV